MAVTELLEEELSTAAAETAFRSGASVDQRMSAGKALRQKVPRGSHANSSSQVDRPDPLDILQAQDQTRMSELVPIRYGRMLASPFAFLRGSAAVMAHDLSGTPASGLIVQAIGDAHLSNFGVFGSPERNLIFDVNDFDETLPAPWEWDVKRLAASVVVAARENGFRAVDCADAARAVVRSYRERMGAFAQLGHLALWYSSITSQEITASLPQAEKKDFQRGTRRAKRRGHVHSFLKMTTVVDGTIRIVDNPPLIFHHSDEVVGQHVPAIANAYRSTIRDDLRALLKRYDFVDFAQKVVGVGSVGTRCYVVLLQGNGPSDPLFLQVKQASPSILEPYAGKSRYDNHGQRVVRGQQYIQAASDVFLGWGRANGVDYYVRQLADMKASFNVTIMGSSRLALYAGLCGWALARAHARSGDAAQIAGYLGTTDRFDSATVDFATAYADQTERDHAALVQAVKTGRIRAEQK